PATVGNPNAVHAGRDDYLKLCWQYTRYLCNIVFPVSRAAVLTPKACLQVYWHHAAGDLDRYVVLISYNHTILQNQSVPTGHNECTFSSLMPGRLYTVTVETWSGSYVSSVSTHGRTRESELKERNLAACGVGFFSPMVCFSVPAAVRNLSVRNTGTADLNVTWSPALGDVDHYEVRSDSFTIFINHLLNILHTCCLMWSLNLVMVLSQGSVRFTYLLTFR
ncbi:hypothetical protein XENOCAPTIV_011102, partial [Xenoophorus captivus]